MHDVPSAFAIASEDFGPVLESLAAGGFVIDTPMQTTITVLDTFDRRLHRGGHRAEVAAVDGAAELTLYSNGAVAASCQIAGVPRFITELPSGDVRNYLASIVGVRALLPVVVIEAERARAIRRGAKGAATAEVLLSTRPRVAGHIGEAMPEHVVELVRASTKKHARSTIELLRSDGADPIGDDLVQFACSTAQITLSASTRPALRLDLGAPALETFCRTLAHLAAVIELNLPGATDDTDPEFLHELRIAVRKTRTVLAQGRQVLPQGFVAEAAPEFAWIGALTGPARDLDVQLLGWPALVDGLGDDADALEPLRAALAERRAEAHRVLTDGLRSERAVALMSTWADRLDAAADHLSGRDAEVSSAEFLRRRIARSHRRLVEHGRLITAQSPAQSLHDLRKDAKRLRYLFESFAPLLPTRPQRAFVRQLRGLQENLGTHQDAEVQEARLRQLALDLTGHDVGPVTYLAVGRLVEQLDQRRLAARRDFAQRFAAFDAPPTRRSLRAVLEELDD